MNIITEITYFIFPLLFAGLIHHLIIIRYDLLHFLSKPVDHGLRCGSKPIFGRSKTWRGILLVPILSGIGSMIISLVVVPPLTFQPFLVGLILGIGYAVTELPNSFIKRQLDVPAGGPANIRFRTYFLVADQVDSVIGSTIAMLCIYPASISLCVTTILIGSSLHFIIDRYLYKHGYKRSRNNQDQS